MSAGFVLASAGLQMATTALGLQLEFAAFFPAIFAASFVGGKPAGIFTAVVTFPLIWWAFFPPAFEFGLLTPAEYDDIELFIVGSILLICVSEVCREVASFEARSAVE